MKILPRNGYILRIWFEDFNDLIAYKVKHNQIKAVKHLEVGIKPEEHEGKKGYVFTLK